LAVQQNNKGKENKKCGNVLPVSLSGSLYSFLPHSSSVGKVCVLCPGNCIFQHLSQVRAKWNIKSCEVENMQYKNYKTGNYLGPVVALLGVRVCVWIKPESPDMLIRIRQNGCLVQQDFPFVRPSD